MGTTARGLRDTAKKTKKLGDKVKKLRHAVKQIKRLSDRVDTVRTSVKKTEKLAREVGKLRSAVKKTRKLTDQASKFRDAVEQAGKYDSRVNKLRDRLKRFATERKSLYKRLKRLDAKTASLVKEDEGLRFTLDGVVTEVERLAGHVEGFDATVAGMETAVADLANMATDLSARYNEIDVVTISLERDVKGLQGDTDTLFGRVDDLDVRAVSLEDAADGLGAALERVEARAHAIQARLEQVQRDNERLTEGQQEALAGGDAPGGSAASVIAEAASVAQRTASLETRSDDLVSEGKTLAAAVTWISDRTEELEGMVRKLTVRSEALEDRLGAQRENDRTLARDAENLVRLYERHEQATVELAGRIGRIELGQIAFVEQAAELENRIGRVADDLHGEIDHLEARTSTLESQLGGLKDDQASLSGKVDSLREVGERNKTAIQDSSEKTARLEAETVGLLRDQARLEARAGKSEALTDVLISGVQALEARSRDLSLAVKALEAKLKEQGAGDATIEGRDEELGVRLRAVETATAILAERNETLGNDLVAVRSDLQGLQYELSTATTRARELEATTPDDDGRTAVPASEAPAIEQGPGQLAEARGELQKRTEALEVEVTGLLGRADDAVLAVAELLQRSETTDARLGEHSQRLEALEGTTPRDGERPTWFEQAAEGIEEVQASLVSGQRTQDERLQRLEEGIVRLDEQASARVAEDERLARTDDHLGQRLDHLEHATRDLAEQAAELTSTMDSLGRRAGERDGIIADLGAGNGKLREALAELAAQAEALGAETGELKRQIGENGGIIEQLVEQQDGHDQPLVQQEQTSTELAGKADSLEARDQALETQLGELATQAQTQARQLLFLNATTERFTGRALLAGFSLAGLVVAVFGLGLWMHFQQQGELEIHLHGPLHQAPKPVQKVSEAEQQRYAELQETIKSLKLQVETVDSPLVTQWEDTRDLQVQQAESLAELRQADVVQAKKTKQMRLDLSALASRVTAQEMAQAQRDAPVPMPAVLHGKAWLLSQPADSYTIQLIAVHRRERIILLTEGHPLPAESAHYRRQQKEKDWFILVSGAYPGFSHAFKALRDLGEPWSGYKPWIRRYSSIQQELGVR